MLVTLSVLTLLLAADEPPKNPTAPAPAPAEVTALAVDVDYLCAAPQTQSLVLPPKAEGQLELPKQCPEAGADWRLSVECAATGACSGEVRSPQGPLARLQGSRKQLSLKAIAPKHPATLDLMRLRITGQYAVKLDSATEHQPPVQLMLQLPEVTGVYTLAPSQPRAQVDFEHQGRRLSLRAQVTREDAQHVHLRLWNLRDELLIDSTLELNQTQPLPCQYLEGLCEGELGVRVREYQRVL